jgi:hypothetical protein
VDNLLEFIVPVIFAAIYFFGNMLSKGADDESEPKRPLVGEDPDVAERQRRIQEEIRRKIMERRSAKGSTGEAEPPRPQPSAQPRPDLVEAEAQRSRPQPTDWQSSVGEVERPRSQPSDSVADVYAFDNDIEAKLQQIEATKRRAEKLKKQARASSSSVEPVQASAGLSHRRGLRGSVRSTLRDPAAARAAFIYGEVLAPPVSQRKSQSVPGLA